jgi:hypothetical protein
MKHWTELNELESAIIRVGEFKNLFKLLVAGTENHVDIKVLQSAIYTMEGMIDDIDFTLYEKFQTVWDAVRDEDAELFEGLEEEYEDETPKAKETDGLTVGGIINLDNMNNTIPAFNSYNYDKVSIKLTPSDFSNNTVTIPSYSTYSAEEDEAFKDLEKAIKNWHKATP